MRDGFRILVLPLLGLALPAAASLQAIDPNALERYPALLACAKQVHAIEGAVEMWQPEWRFDLPRDQAIATLRDCRKVAFETAKAHPKDLDATLLAGLLSAYLYNFDEPGSWKDAVARYDAAQQLAPGDFRPLWLKGKHLVSSNHYDDGIALFRRVAELGVGVTEPFVKDYALSAILVGMPATADFLYRTVEAGGGKVEGFEREVLWANAQKALAPVPADAALEPSDVWYAVEGKVKWRWFTRPLGLAFSTPRAIPLAQMQVGGLKNREAVVWIDLSGKGANGDSSMVVLASGRADDPTAKMIEYYRKSFDLQPAKDVHCPAEACVALEGVSMPVEGGCTPAYACRVLIVSFERNEPQAPGFAIEEPRTLPDGPADGSGAPTYTAVRSEGYRRLDGTLRYLFLVTAPSGAFDQPRRQFIELLKSVRVD